MIVSTNPKFIFLHIPKTAGTSIEEALYEFHDFDYSDDVHIDLMNYYDELPRKEFESFYKFTVIRNPFNLLYSTWAYYVRDSERIKMILELKERELTYRKKTNELIKKLKTFL
jgi:hypothetical protein